MFGGFFLAAELLLRELALVMLQCVIDACFFGRNTGYVGQRIIMVSRLGTEGKEAAPVSKLHVPQQKRP